MPTEAESAGRAVPALPEGDWHAQVLAWWHAVWTSPMAAEYLEADGRRLVIIAALHQEFWTAPKATAKRAAAAEIRLQEVQFGLTPLDRRRLQWEIEKGDQAADKTQRRRDRKDRTGDPRDGLKLA